MGTISYLASQLYFEREPPYHKEQLLKAAGEEVNVRFTLKKSEEVVKHINEVNSSQETKSDSKFYNDSESSKYQLPPEEAIDKMLKIKERFDFDNLSENQQVQVLCDIVNGKCDDMLF
jgi:hypothetical protein